MAYRERVRHKKVKALQRKLKRYETTDQSPIFGFKKKEMSPASDVCTSHVRRISSEIRKKLPKDPRKSVAIIKHILHQLVKSPRKRTVMREIWKESPTISRYMYELGKHRAKKNEDMVNVIRQELIYHFGSLRGAWRKTDCSWTNFYRFTNLTKKSQQRQGYARKLSQEDIRKIHEHLECETVSFPLPDKKFSGKKFLRYSVRKITSMFNLLQTTARNISSSSIYRNIPKHFKLQGKIPLRQSCCEKCQNFENIISIAHKHLSGVPSTMDACVNSALCPYLDFFPNFKCVNGSCTDCGVDSVKQKLLHLNSSKLDERRKRFMVKQWVTKTKQKEGKSQSYLHWDHARFTYAELIDKYVKDLSKMIRHCFFAAWNYSQFKKCKTSLIPGEVLMVHDFAQNYLCLHQDEPQALHWVHEQVTLHPTVVYYKCHCGGLITDEIVHISSDLKHDAHLVKVFTKKTLDYLVSKNVSIRKIIEFTDQAPSQYKSKTVYRYLQERDIPSIHGYYGVRHGKGPCDAVTGRVKQGIGRLVRNRQVEVNSAQTMFSAGLENLQTNQEMSCGKHYRMTWLFTPKIGNRPNTAKWSGIPDSRDYLHCVANSGKKGIVNYKDLLCMCLECRTGLPGCSNVYSSNIQNWSAYNVLKNTTATVNFDLWKTLQTEFQSERTSATEGPAPQSAVSTDSCTAAQIEETINSLQSEAQSIEWEDLLLNLSRQGTYQLLEKYIVDHPIPDFTNPVITDMSDDDYEQSLDYVGLFHMPDDAPAGYGPVKVVGDGNCFPRVLSFLTFRNEHHHAEMRARLVYEAVLCSDKYLDNSYIRKGANVHYRRGDTVTQFGQLSEFCLRGMSTRQIYEKETMEMCKDGTYMGMWQIAQAANLLGHPINSIYPDIGEMLVCPDCHRMVYCYNEEMNHNEVVHIMWTSMEAARRLPNHFVPLLKLVIIVLIHVLLLNCIFVKHS